MSWFSRSDPARVPETSAVEPAAESEARALRTVPAPMATWRLLAAMALCLANMVISGLLLLQHHGHRGATAAVDQLCGPGQTSGCDVVARSRWSQVRGVPLAAVGVAFYGSVALLLLLGAMGGAASRAAAAALALLALAMGMAMDLVLLGVQAVAIRSFCTLCLLTYVLNALALVLLLRARRDGSVVGEAVARPDGRLALSAWVLCTLAVAGGVAFAEYLSRGAPAGGGILGTPSAPPPPAGSEAERYREEARVASEQARRLQEILDDPRKLAVYQAEKAAREHEQAPVHALELDNVPFKGPPPAPIKIVVFSDFLCPFCREVAKDFDRALVNTGGRVAVYYKHYPLDTECNPALERNVHAGACLLALGGVCANEQGKFWPYHDRVFESQLSNPQPQDAVRLALEAGLDATSFEKCLAGSKARDQLARQVAEGRKAGVESTPTLFVNGKRLARLQDFAVVIDSESRRLGLAAAR